MLQPTTFAVFLLAIAMSTATLTAQRPTPTFEWLKRTTTIEYGAVPLGQHSLAELPNGQVWRLGMNEASTWQLTMPVIAGETVLAPGTYRIQLQRNGETSCAILANGSGQALGIAKDGQVNGQLGKAAKPTKKLAIDWVKNGVPMHGNQPAKIALQFGDVEWLGEVTIVGNKTVNLPGWKLTVFTLPAAQLAARDKTPVVVAVLSKGKDQESWNLVLGKDGAKLVPWMTKPTEQFGFGEIVPPDAKLTTTGSVESVEIKIAEPFEVAELQSSSLAKGEFSLQIAFAREAVQIRVPEPKPKAGK